MLSVRNSLAAVLLSALCLVLVSCGDSSTSSSERPPGGGGIASSYPTAVADRFVESCVVNAKLSSFGKLGSDQAREICLDALSCLEQDLTLSGLRKTEQKMLTGEANPGAKALRSCAEEAIERSLE